MAPFLIWQGTKRTVCGNDIDFVENIELEGDILGACWEEHNARGTQTVFYRTSGGMIVVHRVHWSRWENEATVANVFVFSSLVEAEAMFEWELEQAGLIPPRTVSLSE
jgi:hypothetical protein